MNWGYADRRADYTCCNREENSGPKLTILSHAHRNTSADVSAQQVEHKQIVFTESGDHQMMHTSKIRFVCMEFVCFIYDYFHAECVNPGIVVASPSRECVN
jgi:hypothetical protein